MKREAIPISVQREVAKRSNYCDVCRIALGAQFHHVTPVYKGGENTADNLVRVCISCHTQCPDTKEEYKEYRSTGGWFWVGMKLGYNAGKLGWSMMRTAKAFLRARNIQGAFDEP